MRAPHAGRGQIRIVMREVILGDIGILTRVEIAPVLLGKRRGVIFGMASHVDLALVGAAA